jgi:signal transduction histidine kinase/ligand-binding sensor domain-containing protein/CheY-like chemotaxis protein
MPRISRLALGTLNIIICLAMAVSASATTDLSIKFQRLMLADGLSQSCIVALHQDSRGFIWMGTQDGLNRYDGHQIRSFKSDPEDPHSISDANIRCIDEDANGDLWIGTEGDGFNRFDRQTETFERFRRQDKNGSSRGYYEVRSILADPDGPIWVGTIGDGLLRYDPETRVLTEYTGQYLEDLLPGDRNVHSLLLDSRGWLWIGTENGLARLDRNTGRSWYYRFDALDEFTLPGYRVQALSESPRGVLWVGTERGLCTLDPVTGRADRWELATEEDGSSSNLTVQAVQEIPGRQVWVGTEHDGAFQLNLDTGRCRSFRNIPTDQTSLSENSVYSILLDRSGVLWIGTTNGASRMDTQSKQFFHVTNQGPEGQSLTNACVWSMCETRDGSVWIVTEAGTNILDTNTGQVKQIFSDEQDPYQPSYDSFIEVVQDSMGGIWLGARDGTLNRYDPTTGIYKRFPARPSDPYSVGDDRVFTMECDDKNGVWIGTMTGLEYHDLETGKFERWTHDEDDPASLPKGSVRDILLDGKGRLWAIIWGDGVISMDLETHQRQHFHNLEDQAALLSSNVVLSLTSDHHGRIWLGTATGLNLLDPENHSCRWYTMDDGLPNNTIYRVEEDDSGWLWVSTNFGLARFHPDTGEVRKYVERDGIQDNEFNMGASTLGHSGLMYFGGIDGLSFFYPDSIRSNPYVPGIAITDFRVFNKPVPVGPREDGRVILDRAISETDHIELSHSDYVVSFEFSALHYASPLKNNFAYILEGFENEWNQVGNRNHATYTNLPPGNYTFRVRGSNNDGLWNNEGAAVTIHVSPPFYRRAWFMVTALLSVIGTIYGAHRYRMRLLDVKNRALERRVEERTEDLTHANQALQQEIDVRQQIEDELREARNNAVAATQAKSDFLANMSHEIRTPMNGVLGMTSILLDTDLSGDQREYAEAVYTSANNLLIIINDILDFSKVEAGKLRLEKVEFDLLGVLDRLTEMLGFKAQEKNLQFSCTTAPDVPRLIIGDPGRLTQILVNLSNNAVKFTQEGSVSVKVDLSDSTDRFANIHIAVTDTGVGIPADRLEKIFDSFTQVDASVTRKFGGTGLGLAIVRRLAQLMGGKVWAESVEGEGATFHFTAPFERVAGAQDEAVDTRALVVLGQKHDQGTTLGQQLDYLGCDFQTTDLGHAPAVFGRAAAEGKPFDMFFVSDQEDRSPLVELVEQLRSLQGEDALRGVLLCRLGQAVRDDQLKELGMQAFLTMPAQYRKLEALLAGQDSVEEAAPSQDEGSAEEQTSWQQVPVEPAINKPAAEKSTPPLPASIAEPQGPLILLAEDNPINQRVASLLLNKLGYRVDVANNGIEVLEALAAKDYEALLLDVQMPEMDGLEAAQRIRAGESGVRNPAIPIIALTAHAMLEDRRRSLEAGMDDHVSKPIDREIITEVLASYIKSAPPVEAPIES